MSPFSFCCVNSYKTFSGVSTVGGSQRAGDMRGVPFGPPQWAPGGLVSDLARPLPSDTPPVSRARTVTRLAASFARVQDGCDRRWGCWARRAPGRGPRPAHPPTATQRWPISAGRPPAPPRPRPAGTSGRRAPSGGGGGGSPEWLLL